MERELISDEEQQIVKACVEMEMAQDEETRERAFVALMQVIFEIRKQEFVKGMAEAFMIAGRTDLIALNQMVERAAAVIMAERLSRKDNNDHNS